MADAQVVATERFARLLLDPARTPVGPSMAPWAAAFWNWFEREQGGDVNVPLTAAPDSLLSVWGVERSPSEPSTPQSGVKSQR